MNIKKIVVLLIFAIAIVSIISPVNAALECTLWSESDKTVNGRTPIILILDSDIGGKNYVPKKHDPQRKVEVNKVHRISVTIKGYKTVNFRKPVKGWKYETKQISGVVNSFSVKGNAINKMYTIKCYDKKGKLIKNVKGSKARVKPLW